MNRRAWIVFTVVAVWIGSKAYTQQPQQPTPTIQVYVSDMHCGHCAKKIASKLYTVKGVRSVVTNVKSHVAVITPAAGQRISPRRIWETLESIEFQPVKMVTPAGIYQKEPAA